MPNRFFVFILFYSISSSAQLLPFRVYTEKDGLNNRAVYNVIRDDRGLLWVGTSFGINWFDGTHFYQPAVPKKIDQLYVQKFYKDKEGIIWTLSFYNGFYKFQNNHFTQYLIDTTYADINKNNIMDMVETDHSHYVVAVDRGAYLFDGRNFSRLDSKNLNGQIEAVNFFDDCLFVGFGAGLYCYRHNGGRWQLLSKNIEGVSVNKILERDHHVFVATDKGLYYFDQFDPSKTNQPTMVYLKNVMITDMALDASGHVWITANGISYKLSSDKLIPYDRATGLNAFPNHVYFDDQNIGWFSSYGGLYKLGEEYSSFRKFEPGIISLAKFDDQIWMGFPGGFSDVTGKLVYHLPNSPITDLYYASRSKQLWIITDDGVFVFKDHSVQKKWSLHCSCMYEDDDGMLWIATSDEKLFCFKNDHLQPVIVKSFTDDFISAIIKDRSGFLWLGYRTRGIVKCRVDNFDLEPVKEYSLKTGFSDLRVRSCGTDGNGNILFGTRTNGLYIFSAANDRYWHINDSNGLKATWVTAMSLSDTVIYLSTNNGLYTLKKQTSYNLPEISSISFANQAISKEMNCVLTDRKDVWIGSNGLIHFIPDRFQRDTFPSPVFITQVSVNGRPDDNWIPYGLQQKILNLPYNKNVIAFEFAGIHLKDEEALHYRYKLEGQDKDWSSPTQRNFVSYNLLPGKFRFIVQAQNASGAWSNHSATYAFIIAQPFWTTWWFLTINILLAAAIVYLIYQYRLKQAIKFERLRYKISTDLHDDIGSTLSSISILSEMALTENNPGQNEAMVAEIKENSLSLLEKMDDIVWSINPKNDSLESLLLRIKRFSSKLFEAKDIDYSIDIDKAVSDVKLPMEYRQHIYLILKEAINNLVKYSNATKAAIEIHYESSILKIRVSDNGKGFDLKAENSGNGLISMTSRAEMMHASLKTESTLNQGTTIRLEVKIK